MKARYRCPVCGALLTFPGNEYGQVAAEHVRVVNG